MAYSEEIIESLLSFIICLWQVKPLSSHEISTTNIVLADGCIDLVASYDNKIVGYSGKSKTDFNNTINSRLNFGERG